MRADIFADGDLCAGGRRRSGLGLAYARERHRAERRQRAGNEPRLAQEIPAVETAIGLALQRSRKRAAASLTFSAFDQHGRLPSTRITVDAIECLDVLGFLIASLALLIVALGIGARFARQRRSRGHSSGTCAQRTKEITSTELGVSFLGHDPPSLCRAPPHSPSLTTAARMLAALFL